MVDAGLVFIIVMATALITVAVVSLIWSSWLDAAVADHKATIARWEAWAATQKDALRDLIEDHFNP